MTPFINILKDPTHRKWIIGAGVLLICLLFYVSRSTPIPYYKLAQTNIQYTILATGRIAYPRPYQVIAPISGTITHIQGVEGETVSAGELLVQFDDYNEQQQLNINQQQKQINTLKLKDTKEVQLPNLQSKMSQAKVQLNESQKDFNRQQILFSKNMISKLDYEKSLAQYQQALEAFNMTKRSLGSVNNRAGVRELESQLAIDRSQLAVAQKNIQNKQINAPFDGIISSLYYTVGQIAQPGSLIMTLIEQKNWLIEAQVDQKELPYLKMGLPAMVAVDSYPDTKLNAHVVYISPQVDLQNGTVTIRLEITDTKPFVRYGMMTNIEIFSTRFENVLALPVNLLNRTPEGDHVWVWKGGNAVPTTVNYDTLGESWIIIKNLEIGTPILELTEKPKKRIKLGKEIVRGT